MRTRRRATISHLRAAIDGLPRQTRIAMLEAIATNQIIVGAYANRDGICPMLGAHRAGGRTNAIGFAKAWDRFAFRDSRCTRARRATERELLILKTQLEASLMADDAGAANPDGRADAPGSVLAAARAEHLELVVRRQRDAGRSTEGAHDGRCRRPGDPDRSEELAHRPGWAWTRLVRRYDDYERVLARLESERPDASDDAPEPDPGGHQLAAAVTP